MHSPFLHRNFRGPSHLVAATENQKVQSSIFTINFTRIHLHKLLHTDSQPRASQRVFLSNLKSPVVRQITEGSHESSDSKKILPAQTFILAEHKKV